MPPAGGAEAFERLRQRAELLARADGPSASALRYASAIYREQAAMAAALAARASLTGRLVDDLPEGGEALRAYWEGAGGGLRERAELRPYVAELARRGISPDRPRPVGFCSFCGGPPWIASRMMEEGTHGAARRLHCALCAAHWQVNRIRCVSCGEESPAKLPILQAGEYPEARLETCETCKVYVKSIDVSTDPRRIPEVDELLSIALDLRVQEDGLGRLEPGMAGV